jgi:hypothetical protein
LSLDNLLCFVIKPLRMTLSGLVDCLCRFYGGSSARYLLLPAAKVGRLVFMLSCSQKLGGFGLLLTRAPSFFHGSMHRRLQVTHICRDENVACSVSYQSLNSSASTFEKFIAAISMPFAMALPPWSAG